MAQETIKQENYTQKPHIMVVDDDQRIRDLVMRYLTDQDFVVLGAEDASKARAMLESFEVDVLVVDVMMPGESGFEFTKSLREAKGRAADIPVLLLTALGETSDKIEGFEAGADDYLAKPFEPRELVLRLNAILKRTSKAVKAARILRIGPWVFDSEGEVLRSDGGEEQKLTSAEVTLIKALASGGGEVMSRDALAELCGLKAGERTIDVQVTRLRPKLEEDTKSPRYLQTIRGKGYLLRYEEV